MPANSVRHVRVCSLLVVVTLALLTHVGGCGSSLNGAGPSGGSSGGGSGSPGAGPGGSGLCGNQVCSAHGTCVENNGSISCECEEGYVASGLSCNVACPDRFQRMECFEGESLPGGTDLVAALAASRLGGVAPLSVFFDGTGTTSTLAARPFHDLDYCWSFDDGDSGCFGTTGVDKNMAYGAIAGHVFERAGTYEVTLTVRDDLQRQSSATVEIVVTDTEDTFGGQNTVCLSSAGDFDGCPDGATQLAGDNVVALQDYVGENRRLLLRRGERFLATGKGLLLDQPGPGLVASYGVGTPPVIVPDGNAFSIHNVNGATLGTDWRIVDVDIDGEAVDSSSTLGITYDAEDPTFLLMLRVRSYNTGRGVYLYGDANMVQDCEIRDITGGQGANLTYLKSDRTAVLGSILRNSVGGEHVMRIPDAEKMVLSNNEFGEAPHPRHLIKLHAPNFPETGEASGYFVISDNVVHGTGGHGWSVVVGPQNASSDEHVHDVVIERNFLYADEDVTRLLHLGGENITVRSNIFHRATASPFAEVAQRGAEPHPINIVFSNNTGHVDEGSAALAVVSAETTGLGLYNNLVVSPDTPRIARVGTEWLDGTWEPQFGNVTTSLAPFVVEAEPYAGWGEYYPLPDSVVVAAGVSQYARYWDWDRRVQKTAPPVGALLNRPSDD